MTRLLIGAHGLIENKGKYLVTQRVGGDNYMPDKWDLPGGTMEIGETVESGLLREICEESGLKVQIEKPIYVYTTLSGLPEYQAVTIIYACKVYDSVDVTLNPEEHQNFAWKTWEEVKVMENTIHWLEEMGRTLDLRP